MLDYQIKFIELLIKSQALKFGNFVLKSGRRCPYFVNMGAIASASQIKSLGEVYADHIMNYELDDCDVLFGPAYKGIPLAVSTAIALNSKYNKDFGITFDRKEVKDRGEGGKFIGTNLSPNSKILIIEDVISAGTTFKSLVPEIRNITNASVNKAVIAVDREEKGNSDKSAISEVKDQCSIDIYPIIGIKTLIKYLSDSNPLNFNLSIEQQTSIFSYLDQYGA